MNSGTKPDVNDLILRIYDTALDSKIWPELLQDIATYCNARGAFIFELEGQAEERKLNAVRASAIFDPNIVRDYLQKHAMDELSDQEFFASRSQKKSDAIELVPDTEISQDLIDTKTGAAVFDRPHMKTQMEFGFKHRAGALLNKDDLFRDRFALQFSLNHGVVKDEDCAAAAQLMPHLAKAISLARPTTQLQRRYESVTRAVNHLNIGVAILDFEKRVVFRNAEFDRQIETYRAFRVGNDGQLAFSQDRFDRSVTELLGDARLHGQFGGRPRKEAIASTFDDDDGFALCVEIAPLPNADEFGETSLNGHIVYSLDTSQSYSVRTDVLRDLFDLTKSEAEVVSLMAEGLTNQQVSEKRTKSIHTINTQVKSILSKTRTANRTQLIRLATNLSTAMMSQSDD